MGEVKLSEIEQKVYDLLKECKVIPLSELAKIDPRFTGALSRLTQNKLAKLIRDVTEPKKELRKKHRRIETPKY